jgi:hypothetical protein
LRLHWTLAGATVALTATAGEFFAPTAFASADEATNPMEASDNVSASNFFMIFSLSRK